MNLEFTTVGFDRGRLELQTPAARRRTMDMGRHEVHKENGRETLRSLRLRGEFLVKQQRFQQ